MRPSPGDRIKRYILSVCPFRVSDFLLTGKPYRNYQINANIALDKSNYGSEFLV